jgi:plastocyanin
MLLVFVAVGVLIAAAATQKKEEKSGSQADTVKVSNFKFEPKTLTVKVGATVTWTVEGGSHTVISDGKTFTSQNLTSGKSFSHQFNKVGKYPYYCSLHGAAGGKDMAGEIIVTK